MHEWAVAAWQTIISPRPTEKGIVVWDIHANRSMCVWIISSLFKGCRLPQDKTATLSQVSCYGPCLDTFQSLWHSSLPRSLTMLFHCSYCTNISFYLVLKSKRIPAHNHPVIERLLTYRNVSIDLSRRRQSFNCGLCIFLEQRVLINFFLFAFCLLAAYQWTWRCRRSAFSAVSQATVWGGDCSGQQQTSKDQTDQGGQSEGKGGIACPFVPSESYMVFPF